MTLKTDAAKSVRPLLRLRLLLLVLGGFFHYRLHPLRRSASSLAANSLQGQDRSLNLFAFGAKLLENFVDVHAALSSVCM